MFDEKRKSIRIKKPLAVQFGVRRDDKVSWDMSLIKDICESGMCLRTGCLMGPGEKCMLRVRTPTRPHEVLEIEGRVIESTENKSGIYLTRLEFINVTDDQLQFLREYIAWALVNERGRQ